MPLPIIPIILSADDNYAGYLHVCVASIVAHTSLGYQYRIYILDGGISDPNKSALLNLTQANVSIDFVDMLPYINDQNKALFALSLHFSIATYHRFFLPIIFEQFDKAIYIDCDTVVLKDLANLYNIDIGDNYLGATRDLSSAYNIYGNLNKNPPSYSTQNYVQNTLCLNNYQDYIQAGCLIVNLKAMRAHDLTNKFIAKLIALKTPRFVDQCVLNSVCHNHIYFIDQRWNFTWHSFVYDPQCFNHMPPALGVLYKQAATEPWLIHYTGYKCKPTNYPQHKGAEHFWQHAQQTPHYSQFVIDMVMAHSHKYHQAAKNYNKTRFKNLAYKWLIKFTTGHAAQKYQDKLQKNTLQLADYQAILSV